MPAYIFSTLVTVLMVSFQSQLSTGSLIRHRRSTSDLPWATPCGTTTTTGLGGFFTPVEPTLAELADELHLRSLEAHSISISLKNLFFEYRLDSSNSLAQAFEGYNLQNFPLPSDVVFWTHHNFTGDVAKKDYINLSTVLVFLEAIKYDDMEHNNGTLVTEIVILERKFMSILCTLKNIVSNLGLSLDSHVNRDVMPNSLREITSIAERHKRDYVMAKDCVHLMTSTKDSHMAMKLGLQ